MSFSPFWGLADFPEHLLLAIVAAQNTNSNVQTHPTHLLVLCPLISQSYGMWQVTVPLWSSQKVYLYLYLYLYINRYRYKMEPIMQSTIFSNSLRTKFRHDAYAVSTHESWLSSCFPPRWLTTELFLSLIRHIYLVLNIHGCRIFIPQCPQEDKELLKSILMCHLSLYSQTLA